MPTREKPRNPRDRIKVDITDAVLKRRRALEEAYLDNGWLVPPPSRQEARAMAGARVYDLVWPRETNPRKRQRKTNPAHLGRVVLYARHRHTGALLHLVSVDPLTGRVKFSSKGKPYYYRGAPEARAASVVLMDSHPVLRNYHLFWR